MKVLRVVCLVVLLGVAGAPVSAKDGYTPIEEDPIEMAAKSSLVSV